MARIYSTLLFHVQSYYVEYNKDNRSILNYFGLALFNEGYKIDIRRTICYHFQGNQMHSKGSNKQLLHS